MYTELRILDREEFVTRAVLDLGIDSTKKKHIERRKPMEQKTASSVTERASLYAKLREEGANPDEAAQAAGWKTFNSAQSSCNAAGIKISSKAPYLLAGAAPASDEPVPAPTPEPPTPEPACALIPGKMALVDKPRALRPVSWQGKDFLYVDNGGYIEIMPRESTAIQLSYDALKQFSEELQELLEIIQ